MRVITHGSPKGTQAHACNERTMASHGISAPPRRNAFHVFAAGTLVVAVVVALLQHEPAPSSSDAKIGRSPPLPLASPSQSLDGFGEVDALERSAAVVDVGAAQPGHMAPATTDAQGPFRPSAAQIEALRQASAARAGSQGGD